MSEIANASAEQATGIEQVNKALTQMDEVTQQNSALVEENAATAKTLEHQAKAMDERVTFFKLAAGAETVQGAPSRGPAAAKSPAVASQAAVGGGAETGCKDRQRRSGRPHAGRARNRRQRSRLERVLS